MPYVVYLKGKEGNNIASKMPELGKEIPVSSFVIQDGFLVTREFQIPVNNILIIKEL